MVAFYPDRRTEDVRAVVVKDASDCLNGEQMVCVETGITSFKWDPIDGWLPDLRDPATLGCLLALVREAHRDVRIHVRWVCSTGLWMCELDAQNGWRRWAGSEAEALLMALEAAPR